MEYTTLGRTGLKVSVMGLGCGGPSRIGKATGRTEEESIAIIKHGINSGINFIDTAECYGDHLSEQLIAETLQQNRDQWIVATKFGHHYHDRFDRSQLWTADDVRQQLEDSLRALNTDYIDLYQFHSGSDEVFDNDELWDMLAQQVQAGKVRHLGISIGSNSNVYQTSRATELGASVIQVVYNRLDRVPEEEVFPSCLEQDLGVLARVPLASGFLSGKYKPGTAFTDEKDVRSRHKDEQVQARLKEVERLQQEEVPEGMDMATWALAWCLKHPAVSCVIPGCKNPAQVLQNAMAGDVELA